MSLSEAESPHRILASDVVPVHVAEVLRQVQTLCALGRGITVTLEVDDSLFASADPELLVYALGVLLNVTCLGQPELAKIALACDADDGGIRIEAEGEKSEPKTERPISLDLAFAHQAISSMSGTLEVGDASDGKLFRLTLPPARPSRISSRPPAAR